MNDERTQDVSRPDARAADRLLARASGQGRAALGVLAFTGLAMAAAQTALPAVLGRAVDSVVLGTSTSWLAWCGVIVAVLAAADVIDDVVTGTATACSTSWLRRSLLVHVLALGTRAGRVNAGDLSSRMVGNAAAAGRVVPDVVGMATTLVPSVGGVVALALIDPWLCVAFLAGLPLLLLLLRTFMRDASAMAAGYLEVQAGIAGRLVDAFSGVRTIAAAGTADREVRRVLAPLPELRRFGMGMWRAQVRLAAQDALLLPLLEVVVLAVAGFRLASGHLTPGQLLAAGQYVQLASGLGSIATVANRLARARAGAARVADVLQAPPPVYGTATAAGGGRLEFRGVTVRRDGRPVLDDVSLDVPAGALVALVGRSGSGKSLLAALAGRLADPDEGEVLLDGVALGSLSHDALRRCVTYGFERPVLTGATVADAIAFGHTAPAREELVAASCAARADDFVRHLPAGYETPMEDTPLSGGEAQRLGLARTFAHAGRLVVLDDVAASLDTVTEHQIGRVLTGRLGNRTRLVVAQRASTAARADLVVWLERGRVRSVGPHSLLWPHAEYRAVFGAPGPAAAETLDGADAPSNPADDMHTVGDAVDEVPIDVDHPPPVAEPVDARQGAA